VGGRAGGGSISRRSSTGTDNLLVRIHFIIVMIRWTGLLTINAGSCPSIVLGENAARMGMGTSTWSGPDAKWYARQTRALNTSPPRNFCTDPAAAPPPWRQPRGKSIVSLVNSHTNVTSKS